MAKLATTQLGGAAGLLCEVLLTAGQHDSSSGQLDSDHWPSGGNGTRKEETHFHEVRLRNIASPS